MVKSPKNIQNVLHIINMPSGTQSIDREINVVYCDKQININYYVYLFPNLSTLHVIIIFTNFERRVIVKTRIW